MKIYPRQMAMVSPPRPDTDWTKRQRKNKTKPNTGSGENKKTIHNAAILNFHQLLLLSRFHLAQFIQPYSAQALLRLLFSDLLMTEEKVLRVTSFNRALEIHVCNGPNNKCTICPHYIHCYPICNRSSRNHSYDLATWNKKENIETALKLYCKK